MLFVRHFALMRARVLLPFVRSNNLILGFLQVVSDVLRTNGRPQTNSRHNWSLEFEKMSERNLLFPGVKFRTEFGG